METATHGSAYASTVVEGLAKRTTCLPAVVSPWLWLGQALTRVVGMQQDALTYQP
jgi:hypothetical protein